MVFDLLSSGKREPALKNTVDDSDRANDDQHEKPPPQHQENLNRDGDYENNENRDDDNDDDNGDDNDDDNDDDNKDVDNNDNDDDN